MDEIMILPMITERDGVPVTTSAIRIPRALLKRPL